MTSVLEFSICESPRAEFRLKNSKRYLFFWFDFHWLWHALSKIGQHFRKILKLYYSFKRIWLILEIENWFKKALFDKLCENEKIFAFYWVFSKDLFSFDPHLQNSNTEIMLTWHYHLCCAFLEASRHLALCFLYVATSPL